jgi:hypothetical protein
MKFRRKGTDSYFFWLGKEDFKNSLCYIKYFEVIKMVTFQGRITKNFVKIPNKIMSDEGFQNGEAVSISIERVEV